MAKLKNNQETEENSGAVAIQKKWRYSWWAKVLLWSFYIGLGLIILLVIAVNTSYVQNIAATKAIDYLNKDFGIHISKDKVKVNFFGDVIIDGLEVKDNHGLSFIKAKKLRATSNWFALLKTTNNIRFEQLTLIDPRVKVITYKGDSISNFVRFINSFDDGKPRNPNKPLFQLNSRILITNGLVSIVNENNADPKEGLWLVADHFNLFASSFKVVGPDISAKINNLSFNGTRHGKKHRIDTFSGDFKMSPEALSLRNLVFNTDHSLLMGDLIFKLNKKTGWEDFENKVVWNMDIKRGTQISGYDIGYFVKDWDNAKPINVSGKMRGTLNDFQLDNFLVHTPDVTIYSEKTFSKNLLEKDFQITTRKFNADFNYPQLRKMFPTFIAKEMGNFADVFGKIKFQGNAEVQPDKVTANGSLITGIGQARVQSFTLTDLKAHQPKYQGVLTVNDLNTTAFTENKSVGLMSGQINITGKGFDLNTLSLTTKSNITKLALFGKTLTGITVDGGLDHKRFNGTVQLNDPHLKGNLKGLVDFSKSRLTMDTHTWIGDLDLNYFGYTTEKNAHLRGAFDGKLSMKNLNDLNLDYSLSNFQLTSTTQNIKLPNGLLRAYFEEGNRVIYADVLGAIKGQIDGKYNLSDLAGMFKNGLQGAMSGFEPKRYFKNQNFSFSFDLRQNLIDYFMPDLKIHRGAHIDGSYFGDTNKMILNADVPEFWYPIRKKPEITEAARELSRANPNYKIDDTPRIVDSITGQNLNLHWDNRKLGQQIVGSIDEFNYGQHFFRDVAVSGVTNDGQTMHLSSSFKSFLPGQEKNPKEYAININQELDPQGNIVIHFDPTTVKVKNDEWSVDISKELNHSITYNRKTGNVHVHNLRVFSGESSVMIDGDYKNIGDFNSDVTVENLQLNKVMALFTDGSTDLEGVANGSARIVMNNKQLQPVIDLKVKGIKLNGDQIGDLQLNAKNGSQSNIYDVDAVLSSSEFLGGNNLKLTGTVDNNMPKPTLNLDANVKDLDIAFAGGFLKGIFSNVRGKASGDINITGPVDNINYGGNVALADLGFKLDFTGVDYTVGNVVIPLSKGLVQLNDVPLKDGRANSGGSVSGIIQFDGISSIGLNLLVRSNDLMLLNTTQKDFNTFWGRVKANGSIFISGPVNAMNIEADAKVLGGSDFTLNTATTSSVQEFKMLRFLEVNKKTGQLTLAQRQNSGLNMNIALQLDVDKNSTVNVLFGEDLGNVSVRGNAKDLKFEMQRTGAMTMDGTYTAESGTFVSKAILERTFQLQKGSSITWDGDVMNPDLDIAANYTRVVSNLGEYVGVGRLQATPVQLQIQIQGRLNKINPVMDIKLPDASSQIKEALAAKMNTEDEKIKQIGAILIMNSFNTSDAMMDFNVENTGISMGYNMLFKNLASVFNAISKDFQVNLDYIVGDPSAKTTDRANTSVDFRLSNRVKIRTGIGVPLAHSLDAQNNYLSGEGSIEYDISNKNDGTLVLHAYSKPANIGLVVGSNASENQSYGVGVAYSHSFNKFSDLFRKRDKRKKNKNRVEKDSIKKEPVKTEKLLFQ